MAAAGKLLKIAVSPLATALGVFDKKKAAPAPVVQARPVATPRANSVALDALSSRVGSAANQRTGQGGAESRTTSKKQLMGQ